MLEQHFKDREFTPPGEAFINGVPVAVRLRQESPLRATASNPQDIQPLACFRIDLLV